MNVLDACMWIVKIECEKCARVLLINVHKVVGCIKLSFRFRFWQWLSLLWPLFFIGRHCGVVEVFAFVGSGGHLHPLSLA